MPDGSNSDPVAALSSCAPPSGLPAAAAGSSAAQVADPQPGRVSAGLLDDQGMTTPHSLRPSSPHLCNAGQLDEALGADLSPLLSLPASPLLPGAVSCLNQNAAAASADPPGSQQAQHGSELNSSACDSDCESLTNSSSDDSDDMTRLSWQLMETGGYFDMPIQVGRPS